jgi:gamma-glutamyl:cysteine ligase YbdK (ATP-grasp superfamily)
MTTNTEIKAQERKYLCFRSEYGFAQYDENDDSIHHTQDLQSAHEATKEDWSDVIGPDLIHYQFTPANIYCERLKAALEATQQLQQRIVQLVEDRDILTRGLIVASNAGVGMMPKNEQEDYWQAQKRATELLDAAMSNTTKEDGE